MVASAWVWAAELRDPFLFGSQDTPVKIPSQPTLTGILWDATSPLAMINDEPVTVGQHIGGWQVIQIQPDAIVIQRDSRTLTLVPGSPVPSE